MTVRSGERPNSGHGHPSVGAFTGAIRRITRAVPHAVLLRAIKRVGPETRTDPRRDEQQAAAVYYWRSGKVHVSRSKK